MQLLVTFRLMSSAQIVDPLRPDRSDAEPETLPTPIRVTPGSGGSAAEMKTEEARNIEPVTTVSQTCLINAP
jgi:hypothetical protein